MKIRLTKHKQFPGSTGAYSWYLSIYREDSEVHYCIRYYLEKWLDKVVT